MNLYVFRELELQGYYPSLAWLVDLLADNDLDDLGKQELSSAYADLFAALLKKKVTALTQAIAEDLLFVDSAVNGLVELPKSLKEAALLDIEALQSIVKRDFSVETSDRTSSTVPTLNALIEEEVRESVKELEKLLVDGMPDGVLAFVLEHNRSHGTGLLSKHLAYRFADGTFEAVEHPVHIPMSRFIGIDKQLNRIVENTEAFLADKPAQHALLYGMRGSGKSSAVRSLLPAYSEQGLRMIELAPSHLTELNTVVESLRTRPHKYILFVDDLAFEQNDNGFQPLKTLLEGSLSSQPENVLVYATSNRRHLVKEGFNDRPDPLNDDVHKWDTQNERLALSDRFGLTITFPNMQQRQYLEVVNGLIAHEGLDVGDIKQEAIKFADWGNGYSGRTAQQFIRHLKAQ